MICEFEVEHSVSEFMSMFHFMPKEGKRGPEQTGGKCVPPWLLLATHTPPLHLNETETRVLHTGVKDVRSALFILATNTSLHVVRL